MWRALEAALRGLEVEPATCLFRSTEGFNVATVEAFGTDRWGRTSPDFIERWASEGYRGPPRPFCDVVFASTAAEIEAHLATGRGDTALSKCPGTPDAHMLVYRRRALRRVHTKQYAFVGPMPTTARGALVGIWVVRVAEPP